MFNDQGRRWPSVQSNRERNSEKANIEYRIIECRMIEVRILSILEKD